MVCKVVKSSRGLEYAKDMKKATRLAVKRCKPNKPTYICKLVPDDKTEQGFKDGEVFYRIMRKVYGNCEWVEVHKKTEDGYLYIGDLNNFEFIPNLYPELC